jgi:hypothetical protein
MGAIWGWFEQVIEPPYRLGDISVPATQNVNPNVNEVPRAQ